MKFDIFFSICQTEIDGYMPTERVMFQQFFDQLKLADELGFETAWVAETHLSCETQKGNADAVIPHPEWLGREVTDERRYYNVSLVDHPYARWREDERQS